MRILLFLGLGFLFLSSEASVTFPKGCSPLVIQGDVIKLALKKGKLVFFHNIGTNDLWLTHPESEQSANAGWASKIESKHWSALSLDKPFEVTCIESMPGHEQQVPCEGVVTACQWKKVKISEQGTYWASEDKSLSELIATLGSRGIVVPKK